LTESHTHNLAMSSTHVLHTRTCSAQRDREVVCQTVVGWYCARRQRWWWWWWWWRHSRCSYRMQVSSSHRVSLYWAGYSCIISWLRACEMKMLHKCFILLKVLGGKHQWLCPSPQRSDLELPRAAPFQRQKNRLGQECTKIICGWRSLSNLTHLSALRPHAVLDAGDYHAVCHHRVLDSACFSRNCATFLFCMQPRRPIYIRWKQFGQVLSWVSYNF